MRGLGVVGAIPGVSTSVPQRSECSAHCKKYRHVAQRIAHAFVITLSLFAVALLASAAMLTVTNQGRSDMTIGEIIDSLRKTRLPDRGLDAHIGALLDGDAVYDRPGYIRRKGCGSVNSTSFAVRHYTESIDSALMLVPEGVWWTVCAPFGEKKEASAEIYANYREIGGARHKVPATALCIAALKARAGGQHE
jgi:hypothetical protein